MNLVEVKGTHEPGYTPVWRVVTDAEGRRAVLKRQLLCHLQMQVTIQH